MTTSTEEILLARTMSEAAVAEELQARTTATAREVAEVVVPAELKVRLRIDVLQSASTTAEAPLAGLCAHKCIDAVCIDKYHTRFILQL